METFPGILAALSVRLARKILVLIWLLTVCFIPMKSASHCGLNDHTFTFALFFPS